MKFSEMPLASEQSSGLRARLVLAGACLFLVFTAFEIKTPVVSLGSVGFTSSEVAAGIFIVLSLIYGAGERAWYFSRRALDLPVLLFVLVNFLSTALAAEDKPTAFKFSLRMMYAGLVYLAVSRLPGKSRAHLFMAGTVAATLIVVTMIGLAENYITFIYWPDVLEPFHEGIITFGTFYNVRVASTLPFPTLLSMYLELALPIALVFGLWLRDRPGSRRRWLEMGMVVLMGAVMVVQTYTFTRSALVAIPASMIGGAALAAVYGYGRRVWILLLTGVGLLAAVVILSLLFSNKVASRLDVAEQENHYGAEYTAISIPTDLALDQVATARMHIKNTGTINWAPEGGDEVGLSYRWLTYPDKEIRQDIEFLVTPMPHVIHPGEEADFDVDFRAPDRDGKYVLVFDLAKAHVGWFSSAGVAPLTLPLEFTGGSSKPFVVSEPRDNFEAREPDFITSTRSQLWRAGILAWKANPILGLGPDQFRKHYFDYMPELQHDEKVRTHNILLEAAATTGIVGLAVMVFLLVQTVWLQFQLVRKRDWNTSFRLVSLALAMATIAYLFHGVLDYFLGQTGIVFLFFSYLGMTAWLKKSTDERSVESAE
ncbi:MAG: O-antigen ligase family protein [Thermoleophilia bacterium]|nr:O-antigen ligase family protein [Thermoleophilia bacterium]